MQLQRMKKTRKARTITTRATHRPQLFHRELHRTVWPYRLRQLYAMVSALLMKNEAGANDKVEK